MRRPLLCLVLALGALPALGQVISLDGTPGLYGTPHAYVGPRGQKVWENYRRRVVGTGATGVYGSPLLTAQGLNGLLYSDLFMGFNSGDSTRSVYVTPGLFIGRAHATRSYDETVFSFSSVEASGALRPFDLRVAVVEDHAATGGSSFAGMVAANGGEDSWTDLYAPSWGVNGLDLQVELDGTDPSGSWRVSLGNATRVGPQTNWEYQRTSYVADVSVTGATQLPGSLYDLGIPTSQPVTLRWGFEQDAAGSRLVARVGGATVTWVVDDGMTRHGLTDPGNPDGMPYENGALSPDAFVPVLFVGVGTAESPEPYPSVTSLFSVTTASPAIRSLSTETEPGALRFFSVEMQGEDGQPLSDYQGTVHFTSSDPSASLPADYTFQPGDHGRQFFSATFATPGTRSLQVASVQLPAQVATSVSIDVKGPPGPDRGRYGIGCSSSGGLSATLALLTLLWARRPKRRYSI